ncbi:UNVERIFIED_CONTAM: hypothetical protein PYX00_007595 [Menopon gallinae]|uniref:Uncharacterized protein n=1 Tax=Menopon gallinae TaxID=328185 RepID=A0AAW2HJS5_9NEOP
MVKMKSVALEIILTAYLLGPIQGVPDPKGEGNATLSNHGSHYLFKLDSVGSDVGTGKRNSRCSPCGHDPDDRRDVTNYLDPEYRGNGADNLGYDWSPWAWGGPAFSNRVKNQGRQYDGWDRGRGGRQMPGHWIGRPEKERPDHFNCDRCRVVWERERGSRTNGFANRMGRWYDDREEVATVTSPPLTLRPETRIAYIPSPRGEMYWDGVSGGGTRWDGFSNGISWLGGIGKQVNDWKNRLSELTTKKPEDFKNGPPGTYHASWANEPRPPRPGDQAPNNGYASQWHYGVTNQNGWNGNNMKWTYGGKNWDKDGHRNGPPRGGFDEDGNPPPHGIVNPPPHGTGGPHPYGHGTGPSGGYAPGPGPYKGHGPAAQGPYGPVGPHPYGPGFYYMYGPNGRFPYGPYGPGTIQYGQGGSIYYDQGNYIYHFGQNGPPQPWHDQSRYPPDRPSNIQYPARPDQIPRPVNHKPGKLPGEDDSSDRIDNAGNWGRPTPTEHGYVKPSVAGKYPSTIYGETSDRRPSSQRPTPISSGTLRPSTGYPQGGGLYNTGGFPHSGDRYPPGGYNRPGGYPHPEYPSAHRRPGGYPGAGGSAHPGPGGGYPGSSASPGYPGHGGSPPYPGYGSSTGYPGSTGGSIYTGSTTSTYTGGSTFTGSSPSTGYTGGPIYTGPEERPGGGYPNHIPEEHRPSDSGGYGRPGIYKTTDRTDGYGTTPTNSFITAFITEIEPSKYPNLQVELGGNFPPTSSYPSSQKDPNIGEIHWYVNRFPGGDGDRNPGGGGPGGPGGGDGGGGPGGGGGGGGGDGFTFSGQVYGGNRYPNGRDRYRPAPQDRFPVPGTFNKVHGAGDDGNAWNYGQDDTKDGNYRRTGGSYPPYRGGPYYTSSYLASASTPAGVSQGPSEGKTQAVSGSDDVTQPTPEAT